MRDSLLFITVPHKRINRHIVPYSIYILKILVVEKKKKQTIQKFE